MNTLQPVTRLYLIRHGATPLTAEDRFAGSSNVPLSSEGRSQAMALSHRLNSVTFDAVYTSPMDRTLETATILAAPHGLMPQSRDGLREISHGRWEGMTRDEVAEAYPTEVAQWDADPFTFAPMHGESGLGVAARALPEIMDIVNRHIGGHVIVVSHKATIRLILSLLLGFDPRRYRDNLDQSPCALNILDSRSGTCFRLALFNDTSHYGDATTCHVPPTATNRLSSQWSGV